jgi:hypothetical protein
VKLKKNKTRIPTLGVVSLTLLGLASACGDSGTSPEPVTIASITAAVDPDPVSSEASADPDFGFLASFTVTLSETRGTGTSIDSVTVTDVVETLDGEEVETEENALFRADVTSGADRIEGNSSTQIAFDVYYALPGGGSEARIDITLSMTDDYGFDVGGILRVLIDLPTTETT